MVEKGGMLCDEINAYQPETTLVRRTEAYVFEHSRQSYIAAIPLPYEDLFCRPDLLGIFDFKYIFGGKSLVLLATIGAV